MSVYKKIEKFTNKVAITGLWTWSGVDYSKDGNLIFTSPTAFQDHVLSHTIISRPFDRYEVSVLLQKGLLSNLKKPEDLLWHMLFHAISTEYMFQPLFACPFHYDALSNTYVVTKQMFLDHFRNAVIESPEYNLLKMVTLFLANGRFKGNRVMKSIGFIMACFEVITGEKYITSDLVSAFDRACAEKFIKEDLIVNPDSTCLGSLAQDLFPHEIISDAERVNVTRVEERIMKPRTLIGDKAGGEIPPHLMIDEIAAVSLYKKELDPRTRSVLNEVKEESQTILAQLDNARQQKQQMYLPKYVTKDSHPNTFRLFGPMSIAFFSFLNISWAFLVNGIRTTLEGALTACPEDFELKSKSLRFDVREATREEILDCDKNKLAVFTYLPTNKTMSYHNSKPQGDVFLDSNFTISDDPSMYCDLWPTALNRSFGSEVFQKTLYHELRAPLSFNFLGKIGPVFSTSLKFIGKWKEQAVCSATVLKERHGLPNVAHFVGLIFFPLRGLVDKGKRSCHNVIAASQKVLIDGFEYCVVNGIRYRGSDAILPPTRDVNRCLAFGYLKFNEWYWVITQTSVMLTKDFSKLVGKVKECAGHMAIPSSFFMAGQETTFEFCNPVLGRIKLQPSSDLFEDCLNHDMVVGPGHRYFCHQKTDSQDWCMVDFESHGTECVSVSYEPPNEGNMYKPMLRYDFTPPGSNDVSLTLRIFPKDIFNLAHSTIQEGMEYVFKHQLTEEPPSFPRKFIQSGEPYTNFPNKLKLIEASSEATNKLASYLPPRDGDFQFTFDSPSYLSQILNHRHNCVLRAREQLIKVAYPDLHLKEIVKFGGLKTLCYAWADSKKTNPLPSDVTMLNNYYAITPEVKTSSSEGSGIFMFLKNPNYVIEGLTPIIATGKKVSTPIQLSRFDWRPLATISHVNFEKRRGEIFLFKMIERAFRQESDAETLKQLNDPSFMQEVMLIMQGTKLATEPVYRLRNHTIPPITEMLGIGLVFSNTSTLHFTNQPFDGWYNAQGTPVLLSSKEVLKDCPWMTNAAGGRKYVVSVTTM